MDKATFKALLRQGNLQEMFISKMGWNNYRDPASLHVIRIDEHEYHSTTIAERSGLQVLECIVAEIPTPALCRRIDVRLRGIAQDYIAIYRLQDSEHHQWVTPVRKVDKRDIVTIEYATVEQADFLFEKIQGLVFGLVEVTTIVDVQQRIQQTFAVNSERITKDFYRGFRKEHHEFVGFITGIDDQIGERDNRNKQWYASVMLNRLMFCYFIQKKGFLDRDTDYLNNKLRWCQEQHGEGQFYKSFYRDFLVHLFRDGLNRPGHDPHFEERFGRIPYLNGGMFDLHQIERDYQEIDIADEAFERLFNFFDQWRWHLDTRISATGRDINPDVLGYIFEQYINDRAQMGAYYTKEDITEYIGRNCILPFLMDKVAVNTPKAFSPKGEVWTMLQQSGDRYLFDAVKQGYTEDWRTLIPENIAIGLDTTQPNLLERRKDWNTRTLETFALPTEIWRETIDRLQRSEDIIGKMSRGEIHEVNDFITYNLDIRRFAQDLLEQTEDHLLVAHFYHALQQVTILDPTCGSGAFLFAALNILEPLYETCISRMEDFHQQNANLFKEELAEISQKYRSNIQYFIYKSIILRNLYGVDIMAEAVEIAKLRLFLKMVAVVEVDQRADNLGLDPLPDIDFNIRCGNTLVGYATEQEVYQTYSSDIFTSAEYEQLAKTEMQKVSMAYRRFRDIQLTQQEDMKSFVVAKVELKQRLSAFIDLLNRQMFSHTGGADYDAWLDSNQPFHWIAEYYQIIHGNGGFDVVIGNPPYVEISKNKIDYKLSEVYRFKDLYAYVLVRALSLAKNKKMLGFIIPVSFNSTPNFKKLFELYQNDATLYMSSYADTARMFMITKRLSIVLRMSGEERIYSTKYIRLNSTMEHRLAEGAYCQVDSTISLNSMFPKVSSPHEVSIISKVKNSANMVVGALEANTGEQLNYTRSIRNFRPFYLFKPTHRTKEGAKKIPTELKSLCVDKDYLSAVTAVLNSNLTFELLNWFTDVRNVNPGFIRSIPLNKNILKETRIEAIIQDLMRDYQRNMKERYNRTTQCFESYYYPVKSKPIIDEIDKVLAEHYGFTEEELDFIINYDIKYRMGDELQSED